jgi:hypothetical protein
MPERLIDQWRLSLTEDNLAVRYFRGAKVKTDAMES